MHRRFESLSEDNEFIVLNDIVVNVNQIKNGIVNDFKPKTNDLNFCRKNLFLKQYFREINNQGIFNRIEWKFLLKKDIQCELIASDKIKQVDKLQLRIILNFSSTLQIIPDNEFDCLSHKENENPEYFDLKVLLYYSLQKLKIAEEPTTISTTRNYIDTIYFQNINQQNNPYSYPLSSEKICI
ncbi:MAG: hypothetical protein VKN72_14705 [Nostocales cyanobacterium 94392]|nr:hypothetical protein [Nostocales cyanobacterium 94392]